MNLFLLLIFWTLWITVTEKDYYVFLVSPHLAGFEDCTFFKVHSPVTENKAIEGYSQETHWGKTGFFFFSKHVHTQTPLRISWIVQNTFFHASLSSTFVILGLVHCRVIFIVWCFPFDFHLSWMNSTWQLTEKKSFHLFHQLYCWLVDYRLSASIFGEDEVDSVSRTWCLSCHGDTVVEHRLVSFTRALTCDSACLANYSPCYPFPWHTHFVPHSNSSGRSSDSVPLSRSLPSFFYFWHQTFWARRSQHNVNYSAWLARGWEQIINRRWSQAISYGWLWLNTNAQNHFQTHTNIRFHYL